jgi:transcriptional regulator with XRE-family HTH domain
VVGRPSKQRPEALPPEDAAEEQRRRQAMGARIRSKRESLQWSFRDLEQRSGIDKKVLQEIESGSVDARTGTIARIARALGCDPRLIFVGGDEV